MTKDKKNLEEFFSSIKKINKNGEKIIKKLNRKNDIITDNLIIKGDSFGVLKKLQLDFKGQIKLIYIDPPYNTGNKCFIYDDSFEHSVWLKFMKESLKLAKTLLRNDGVIFVQCDDNEQAYLKILLDEIFGRDKAFTNIIWEKGNAQNDAKAIQKNHEYILGYYVNECSLKEKIVKEKKVLKDKFGYYYLGSGITTGGEGGILNRRPTLGYSIYLNEKTGDFVAVDDYDRKLAKISNDEKLLYKDNKKYIKKGYTKIIRPKKKNDKLGCWTWSLEKFNKDKKFIHISENYTITQKKYIDKDLKIKNNKVEIIKYMPPKSIWKISSGKGSKLLNSLFTHKAFDNPKPEELIKKIIEISTKPGDIVLDYYLGSGTTASVAHKMGRQYIGIEKMDYIEDLAVERLKKVIAGEDGGISKEVSWKGGGEFVYLSN